MPTQPRWALSPGRKASLNIYQGPLPSRERSVVSPMGYEFDCPQSQFLAPFYAPYKINWTP